MCAKQNSYNLTDIHTFVANTTTRVRLPLSGYITHIDLLLRVNTTGIAHAGMRNEDWAGRLIRALRVRASGARSFVDFSDGRQLWYYSWLQYQGHIRCDEPEVGTLILPVGAPGANNYFALIPLHIGLFPEDPYDTSVVIPAVETTDLVIEVTWGAGTDVGPAADVTFNAADITMTVYEVALAPGEKRSDIWKKGLLMPRFEPQILNVAATFANLGLTQDMPVGDTLVRTVMMVTSTVVDARGTRNDLLVTEVGVRFPKMREIPWQRSWRQFVYETHRRNKLIQSVGIPIQRIAVHEFPGDGALITAMDGVGQIEGSQLSGRSVGLDLSHAVTGDAQYAFSTNAAAVATGQIHLLHYLVS